ncbi:MAG: endonuclease V [Candidatus Hodarchaeales archaeon]
MSDIPLPFNLNIAFYLFILKCHKIFLLDSTEYSSVGFIKLSEIGGFLQLVLKFKEMERTQIKRASLVEEKDYFNNPKTLLAVAVSQKRQKIMGGSILYDLESHNQIDSWLGEMIHAPHRYISTLLSLRNKQPLLQVINQSREFDLLMVEGAGKQHPRHFGLACELGVDLNVPTIGITQRSLFGEIDFSHPLEKKEYDYNIYPVFEEKHLIAYFIKKQSNKQGIFLSIGHKISLQTALETILPLLIFKLPEPLRLVKSLLKNYN